MSGSAVTEFGYFRYLGEVTPPENPRILTRLEKGQALTHLEMDVNLCSLFHTLSTGSVDAYGRKLLTVGDEVAEGVYPESAYSLDYVTKKDYAVSASDNLYALFHYAPCLNGTEGDKQFHYASASIKVQHSIPEILYMVSDEEIPGNLNIRDNFNVSGSSDFRGKVKMQSEARISGSTYIGYVDSIKDDERLLALDENRLPGSHLRVANSASCQNLLVRDSASLHGNLYVSGNLFVDGLIFGKLSRYGKYYDQEGSDHANYAPGVNDGGYVISQDTIQGEYSDERLKDIIGEIEGDEAWKIVSSIGGYRFTWKNSDKRNVEVGVIAQEVQKVLPEAVDISEDRLRVKYTKLIPVLMTAVGKLIGENKELWQEIERLKNK